MLRVIGWALLAGCTENQLVGVPDEDLPAAMISVEPRSLDFGDPPAGDWSMLPVTIANIGGRMLTVGAIDVPVGQGFGLEGVTFLTLASGDNAVVNVSYLSSGTERVAEAAVYSDDPVDPRVAVDLVVGRKDGVLVVAPDPVDFGSTALGWTIERPVTLTNEGTGPLRVDGMHTDGAGFTILDAPETPFTIEAGDTTEITLGFSPVTLPTVGVGLLWVDSNASATNAPVDLAGKADLGGIRGRICDPSGDDYVVGARVWVDVDFGGDGTVDYTVEDETDKDGWFELWDLPPGVHTVHVEKGLFGSTFAADVKGAGLWELPDDECIDQGDLTIAVIPGSFDEIGSLLDGIGLAYDVKTTALFNSRKDLDDYDMVFVACSSVPSGYDADELRDWIELGGRLYASDLAVNGFETLFPDEYSLSGSASAWGSTVVTLLDADIIASVGTDTLTVTYESGVSPLLLDGDSDVDSTILIEVDLFGIDVPATVRMQHGFGSATFTAFHTSKTGYTGMSDLFEALVWAM